MEIFDQNGNIIWVCKSDVKNNNDELEAEMQETNNEENNTVEKAKSDTDVLSSALLFPNPFRDELNVKFYSNVMQEISIQLINTNGQRIISKKIMVEKGNNKLNIINNFNSIDGLYFLQIIENSGNIITKQVIKIE